MKTYLYILALAVIITGCVPLQKFNSNSNRWKPKDLKLNNRVLVIQTGSMWGVRRNRKIREFVGEKYPFESLFMDKFSPLDDTLSAYSHLTPGDNDFNDKEMYRFVIRPTYQIKQISHDQSTASHDLYFYDRVKNKKYNVTGISCSNPVILYKKVIRTLLSDYQ